VLLVLLVKRAVLLVLLVLLLVERATLLVERAMLLVLRLFAGAAAGARNEAIPVCTNGGKEGAAAGIVRSADISAVAFTLPKRSSAATAAAAAAAAFSALFAQPDTHAAPSITAAAAVASTVTAAAVAAAVAAAAAAAAAVGGRRGRWGWCCLPHAVLQAVLSDVLCAAVHVVHDFEHSLGRPWQADLCVIDRVGQNHIYTVYIRYFWQGNHQIYGHIRCIYTVLANPSYRGREKGVSIRVAG